VRQFVYTVYLPGQKKTVQIKELQFNRYKHLVKIITNNNDEIVANFFDELLFDLCPEEKKIRSFSFLDKLIILLTIRIVCISPQLELIVNCPATQKQFNTTAKLSDIIDKLQNLNLADDVYLTTKEYNTGDLKIDLGMPSTLNIKERDLTFINTVVKKISLSNNSTDNITEQLIDRLPAFILSDITSYISYFNESLQNINLINIKSPFATADTNINIPLNLFSNSIIEFLKIVFKRGLLSIYELEYFLINKLNIDYDLIKTSTPAELNVYINFFKEEKEKEEKAERKKSLNLPNTGPI
jgi:hypothetical protein